VKRAFDTLETAPPVIDAVPNVGAITLACALGYGDLRFEGKWRKDYPRLLAWHDDFEARVPAFAKTRVAA
jgi:glutathione S-transferase